MTLSGLALICLCINMLKVVCCGYTTTPGRVYNQYPTMSNKDMRNLDWARLLVRQGDETNTVVPQGKDYAGQASNCVKNYEYEMEFGKYGDCVKDSRVAKHDRFIRRIKGNPVNVLEGVIRDVRREFYKNYDTIVKDIEYFENDNAAVSNCYVCVLSTGTLFRVSSVDFNDRLGRYETGKVSVPKYYVRATRYGQKILYVVARTIHMKSQISLTTFTSVFDKVIRSFTYVKDTMNCLNNMKWKPILADTLALILNLRDGYISVPKILAAILQIYSLDNRIRSAFHGQTTGAELMTLLGIAGLPKQLLDAVKTFTTLTGKKVFDSSFVMQCFASLVTIVKHLLGYVAEKEKELTGTNIASFLDKFVDFIGSSAIQHGQIDKVIKMYTSFMKDASIIHDARVRADILELYSTCMNSRDFRDYVANSSNRDFQVTWKAFCENVVKLCKTYGVSNRVEPVAFIFEGGAGSGKTTLMNSFVEYLSKKDLSVYVHTVPASENGKDFYDDYNNEDVFVMDDVGQQGKSQWRTMINFVSTTKFPLDCARAENKNTKSFNSSLILATTNHFRNLTGFTASDCISEPDALFRRPHVIDVASHKDKDGYFYQHLRYYRYNFRADSPSWVGGFLEPCLGAPVEAFLDTSQFPPGKRKVASLKWLSQIVQHVRKCTYEDNVRSMVTDVEVEEIDSFMWDAQFNVLSSISNWIVDPVFEKAGVWKEWCVRQKERYTELCQSFLSWFGDNVISLVTEGKSVSKLVDYVSDKSSKLYDLWSSVSENTMTLTLSLVFAGLVTLIGSYFFSDNDMCSDNIDVFVRACEDAKKRKDEKLWLSQSGASLEMSQDTSRLTALKQHMRLVVRRSEEGEHMDTFTQAIVSGNKILVPAHAWPQEAQIDVYISVDAYKNKCKEREDVKVKCVRMYPGCDLAVYELDRLVARYKNCNNLFLEANVKNPILYLVNSYSVIPVLLGVSCVNNTETVRYSNYLHAPNTGFYTPLTAGGACGTVLFSEDHGIIGFHVAGGDEMGFCVVPPRIVAEEIRKLMLHKEDVQYEFDTKIIENFSGARLRYPEGYVKPTSVLKNTSFIPTIFNISNNKDVAALKRTIMDDRSIAPVQVDEIRDKVPPVFDAAGSPNKQLKATAKKSFKLQGRVTPAECDFVSSCIDDMIPEFDDLTDDECAFGNDFLPALNKDSSNGYGCLRGKDMYFDFQEKKIYDHTLTKFARFKDDVENDNVDIRDVLSTESFKDELRTEDKKTAPRTFRVMPLPHIWFSKKIFGKTMPYFKENRHKTGMCVGFNPFKDCDIVAEKLRDCEITGDIDFSKWDGSIMSSFMYIIGDAFKKKYRGKNVKMLDFLISSSATSCVLVNDELLATTHGLPSGTWLTLVMNSLINKCLTALTLYRYDTYPSLDKFYRVVDYVMGDDKVIGAMKEDKHWFNLSTINAVATSLGMVCTNGDKTPITKIHQPFDKLSFVKRHFRYHPVLKKYVGCLSVETLLGTIQWMDSSKELEEVLPGKIRSVLVEAYLHSPGLYHAFKRVFDIYRPGDSITENKVLSILKDDNGYLDVLRDMGKDFHYLE
nr:MAG: RNA-dependent RNA polymerase [flactilig virus 9]